MLPSTNILPFPRATPARPRPPSWKTDVERRVTQATYELRAPPKPKDTARPPSRLEEVVATLESTARKERRFIVHRARVMRDRYMNRTAALEARCMEYEHLVAVLTARLAKTESVFGKSDMETNIVGGKDPQKPGTKKYLRPAAYVPLQFPPISDSAAAPDRERANWYVQRSTLAEELSAFLSLPHASTKPVIAHAQTALVNMAELIAALDVDRSVVETIQAIADRFNASVKKSMSSAMRQVSANVIALAEKERVSLKPVKTTRDFGTLCVASDFARAATPTTSGPTVPQLKASLDQLNDVVMKQQEEVRSFSKEALAFHDELISGLRQVHSHKPRTFGRATDLVADLIATRGGGDESSQARASCMMLQYREVFARDAEQFNALINHIMSDTSRGTAAPRGSLPSTIQSAVDSSSDLHEGDVDSPRSRLKQSRTTRKQSATQRPGSKSGAVLNAMNKSTLRKTQSAALLQTLYQNLQKVESLRKSVAEGPTPGDSSLPAVSPTRSTVVGKAAPTRRKSVALNRKKSLQSRRISVASQLTKAVS